MSRALNSYKCKIYSKQAGFSENIMGNKNLSLVEVSKERGNFVSVPFEGKNLAVLLENSEIHVYGVIEEDFTHKCIANHSYSSLFKLEDTPLSRTHLLNRMEQEINRYLHDSKRITYVVRDAVHFYGFANAY